MLNNFRFVTLTVAMVVAIGLFNGGMSLNSDAKTAVTNISAASPW